MQFLRGLAWHLIRILLLVHPGCGLPVKSTGALRVIYALSLSASVLRWSVLGTHPLWAALLAYLAYVVLVFGIIGIRRVAVVMLASLGIDLLAIVLQMAGAVPDEFRSILSLWEFLAITVVLLRQGRTQKR